MPEYLLVFGDSGPVSVHVEGPEGPLPLPPRSMCAEDIAWLVSADGQLLRQCMLFDGQARTITACTLDPAQQRITIRIA